MYIREVGPKEFPQTFKQWMEAKGDLEALIAEGRSKLEWERKIPDEKLVELKELLDSKDFKANLSRVIKRIYELSWEQVWPPPPHTLRVLQLDFFNNQIFWLCSMHILV